MFKVTTSQQEYSICCPMAIYVKAIDLEGRVRGGGLDFIGNLLSLWNVIEPRKSIFTAKLAQSLPSSFR